MLGVPLRTLTFVLNGRGTAFYYRTWSIKKRRFGGTREINAPTSTLWRMQSAFHEILRDAYTPRPATHGFVKDRSILSNARRHVGSRFVLTVDIQDFFPSIHFGRVRGLFLAHPFYCSPEVATVLAQLCCHDGRLPIGAPTSPVIANMVCVRMDKELQLLAKEHKCFFTRYADDLTFSTKRQSFPPELAKVTEHGDVILGEELLRVIEENRFSANDSKSRLQTTYDRQIVTGIKVNERPNVDRRFVRRIRGMIHSWDKYGLKAAQQYLGQNYTKDRYPGAEPKLLNVLRGRIEYLGMIRGQSDAMVRRFHDQYDNLLADRDLNFGIDYHPESYDDYRGSLPDDPHRMLTVMFSDIVQSTTQTNAMGDDAWNRIREKHDHLVRLEVRHRWGHAIKGTGDGLLAVFDRPSLAVEAARKIVQKVETLGIEVGVGLHTQEVTIAGGDAFGSGVNAAARIASAAGASQVLVSQALRALVAGNKMSFEDLGEHQLEGFEDPWRIYSLILE
jgi:RNA-directed DNA polymerase